MQCESFTRLWLVRCGPCPLRPQCTSAAFRCPVIHQHEAGAAARPGFKEAQILTDRWRVEYNTQRPHSALSSRPPAPQAILTKQPGLEIWKTLRVSHIPTPPAAATDRCLTRRYTNPSPGTKTRPVMRLGDVAALPVFRKPKRIVEMGYSLRPSRRRSG
jgi:hypothetical protein